MDVNTLIRRIQDPSLVANDDTNVWKEISEHYPYFSIGRYLEFMNEVSQNEKADLEFVSMYKHNPILFAQMVHPIKNRHRSEKNIPENLSSSGISPEPEPIIIPELTITNEKITLPEIPVAPEPITIPELTITNEINTITETPVTPETIIIPELPITQVENNITEMPVWNEPSMSEIEEKTEFSSRKPIEPVVEDYITSQAEGISDEHVVVKPDEAHWPVPQPLPEDNQPVEKDDKSLMVMMSFMDWIQHLDTKSREEQQEEKEKRALRTAWQKEKLNAIVDEGSDEIPESIFKQAMESVSPESGIVSESLAQLLAQQGKTGSAIEMYKKLSLRNPEKSAYFADLIRKIHLNNL